ncbi:MAG: hypothetical protein DI539_11510 [Flavobacterium psychrophilum]|nr:MAG: hypothetical protein DI539_11510 [Flavobacterium psychrophilum]
MLHTKELRESLLGAEIFRPEILDEIHRSGRLQIWVPKEYNGLGLSFCEGLKKLQQIAKIDGSLGWFVTLCSGANYFSRNLRPETASRIFGSENICFGGSGMLGGTAEKIGDNYLINGFWKYATGAPYLTHFTLNAKLVENGQYLLDSKGEPQFLSFVLTPAQVELITAWKSMGMIATASHSFKVQNQLVPVEFSFTYNKFYSNDPLDRIPFQTFADLTLLVNYIGMASHFAEKALEINIKISISDFSDYLNVTSQKVIEYAVLIEKTLSQNIQLDSFLLEEIHSFGKIVVTNLVHHITKIYPQLGIRASACHEEINQVFRDFFTATQHSNFRKSDL